MATNPNRRRWIKWIAIPLAMWAVAEFALGRFFAHNLRWYEAAEQQLRSGPPVQAIFLGSSRVNAAIDPEAAGAEAARLLHREFRTLNLGYGDTNLTEHYLGLRYLFESHPEKLKGVTVFIEAAGGMPEYRTWDEPWIESNVSAVLPFMQARDLSGIWRSQGTFETKTEVTLRLATRWSNVLARKDKVQQYAFMVNDTIVAPKLVRTPPSANGVAGDLTTEGGIRADSEGVREARNLATRLSQSQLESPLPDIDTWNGRVVDSLVKLIRENGGTPVFVRVPMSSVMEAPYGTGAMLANVSRFREQAKKWGCPILTPLTKTTDGDFPDLWHMRKSLAPEFSRRLIDNWVTASLPSRTR